MDPGEAGCLDACRQLSLGGCCSDDLIGTCAELDLCIDAEVQKRSSFHQNTRHLIATITRMKRIRSFILINTISR